MHHPFILAETLNPLSPKTLSLASLNSQGFAQHYLACWSMLPLDFIGEHEQGERELFGHSSRDCGVIRSEILMELFIIISFAKRLWPPPEVCLG